MLFINQLSSFMLEYYQSFFYLFWPLFAFRILGAFPQVLFKIVSHSEIHSFW